MKKNPGRKERRQFMHRRIKTEGRKQMIRNNGMWPILGIRKLANR